MIKQFSPRFSVLALSHVLTPINCVSRSANQVLVPLELTRTAADHRGDLLVLLPLRWPALHEEPETLSAEKHINRVQHHPSRAQCRARDRGEVQEFI
jgi:hypothetical protein